MRRSETPELWSLLSQQGISAYHHTLRLEVDMGAMRGKVFGLTGLCPREAEERCETLKFLCGLAATEMIHCHSATYQGNEPPQVIGDVPCNISSLVLRGRLNPQTAVPKSQLQESCQSSSMKVFASVIQNLHTMKCTSPSKYYYKLDQAVLGG